MSGGGRFDEPVCPKALRYVRIQNGQKTTLIDEPVCPAGGSLCQNSERQKPALIDEQWKRDREKRAKAGQGKERDSMGMKAVEGGVLAAKGFMASAAAAGIKYKDRTDMAMVFSSKPCVLAAVFTRNVVKAAPVLWDRQILEAGAPVQAIVANAGIANACTGKEGMDICIREAEKTADCFGNAFGREAVLIASTGVIGKQLPIERVEEGIESLVRDLEEGASAATAASRAIMTTDTRNKEFAVSFMAGGTEVHIGGMCKGSGMIHPDMCTMLSFLTTDCAISRELMQKALSDDVRDTYNMVSVDGDTSTNDTCLLLSNGAAGNPVITEEGEDYEAFRRALHAVNEALAKKMAEDGEGATHLFEVRVTGARNKEDAVCLAKSVVSSSLVKAAIYGRDANWGRILAALGYSGVSFDPDKVRLYFVNDIGKLAVYMDGSPVDFSEDFAKEILSQPEVTALAEMGQGDGQATAWGCDLTHEYVSINADYRS